MLTKTPALSPTAEDIGAAHERIAPHVRRTPVWRLPAGAFGHDGPVSLKLEYLQHAGSFKARGAFNTLLSQAVPAAGVGPRRAAITAPRSLMRHGALA